jgi:hypothetical protein
MGRHVSEIMDRGSVRETKVVVVLMTNCQVLSILGDVMEHKAMVRFLC